MKFWFTLQDGQTLPTSYYVNRAPYARTKITGPAFRKHPSTAGRSAARKGDQDAGGLGEEAVGGYCLTGTVPVWGDKNILETDSNNGHTTQGIYSMPLNYMLKNVKFYVMYIFTIIVKKVTSEQRWKRAKESKTSVLAWIGFSKLRIPYVKGGVNMTEFVQL